MIDNGYPLGGVHFYFYIREWGGDGDTFAKYQIKYFTPQNDMWKIYIPKIKYENSIPLPKKIQIKRKKIYTP